MSFDSLVICGPSGSGKSTLLKYLFLDFPNVFEFSVSHTTRTPRPGEVDGKDYFFTDKKTIKENIAKNHFIETTNFCGNIYGTSKTAVKEILSSGKICVFDVDIEGVKQIRSTDLKPLYVFVNPPSLLVLEKRLRNRQTESEERLKARLENAQHLIEYGK